MNTLSSEDQPMQLKEKLTNNWKKEGPIVIENKMDMNTMIERPTNKLTLWLRLHQSMIEQTIKNFDNVLLSL